MDEMARALIDSEVFVAFVSVDYCKNEDCTNIFKYARLTLRKPMVVVAVGNGFEWKQSKLGILLSDEVRNGWVMDLNGNRVNLEFCSDQVRNGWGWI